MAKLIEMNIKTSSGYETLYPVTVGMVQPQVIVSGINGTTVTASNGSSTISATISNGTGVLNLDDYGTWIITSTLSGAVKTGILKVDTVKQYEFDGTLNYFRDQPWNVINSNLNNGNLGQYNIGDYHPIILNGTAGNITFDNVQAYAIIIGKNHNSSIEGNNKLHLQIALNTTNTQTLQNTQMNTTDSNVGGWNGCYMRNTICSQFLNCLPSDLREIIKDTTKYTDNYGNNGQNNQSHVTSTTDKVFLLSEYEIFGTCTQSNTYEANYQQQYEWYKGLDNAGRIKYQYNVPTSAVYYWERSPFRGNAKYFCFVFSNGTTSYNHADYSNGFAPCLCI